MKAAPIATVICWAMWASVAAAAESVDPAERRASVQPDGPWLWGLEGGFHFGSRNTTFSKGGPDSRNTTFDASVLLGAVLQRRLSRVLWLGPRVAGQVFLSLDGGSVIVDAGVLATFRWLPDAQFGPRFLLQFGPSLAFLEAPRSFAIEHDVSPALGPHFMIGTGVDRRSRSGETRWFLDIRWQQTAFEHEHTMRDTRTGERTTEDIDVVWLSVALVFGFGWH